MRAMYNWLDKSPQIKETIKLLSSSLASKRGIPLMAAIGLTILSLIVHLIAAVTGSVLVGICGFTFLHLAILIGFLGVLLAEPLGRG